MGAAGGLNAGFLLAFLGSARTRDGTELMPAEVVERYEQYVGQPLVTAVSQTVRVAVRGRRSLRRRRT